MVTDQIDTANVLRLHQQEFHPVVPFNRDGDKLLRFDFTVANKTLSAEQISDTDHFSQYIRDAINRSGAAFGIGGYNEHRTLYARSKRFGEDAEARRLHLGTDIWGPAGTRVTAPMDGIVHSFAFNHLDSDYGATIILSHILDGVSFHTLYGHLSLNSIKNLHEGKHIYRGQVFAEFGMRFENGNWPPHLHLQIIEDMQNWQGDYPGVCRFDEREQWLANCPDPELILQLNEFVIG